MIEFKVLTLFPDMVRAALGTSILARAASRSLVGYSVEDIRNHAVDKHRTVDDTPYGGGPGMIMMAPCIVEAVEAVRQSEAAPLWLTSPQGERLDENLTLALIDEARQTGEVVLVCGHYKGIDERARQLLNMREISIGDYVLSGGELPALVIIDAIVRRIEGVLSDSASAENDSFTAARQGGLDCPWYTRPAVYRGLGVPEVLLSGNHSEIEKWRQQQAHRRTQERRPDLLRASRH
jgi:tRNA (guanine37-N1)-methyltransferase